VAAPELRVGMVGAGWIAATHRDTLDQAPGARLVAAAGVVCAVGYQYRTLPPPGGPPPLRISLERFLAAVRAGDPAAVACPLVEGVATLEVALACEQAVQSGATVALGAGRPARNP